MCRNKRILREESVIRRRKRGESIELKIEPSEGGEKEEIKERKG